MRARPGARSPPRWRGCRVRGTSVPATGGPDYPRLARAPGLGVGCAAAGAVAGGALGWRLGAVPVLPAWLYLVAIGLLLSYVDLREHRLPDAVVLPSLVILPLLLVIAAVIAGGTAALGRALACGVGSAAFLLLAWLLPGRGLGFGDVKLVALTGAALGWLSVPAALLGLFAGLLLAAAVAVALLAAGRADRRTPVPLGPALLAGAVLIAVLGGLPAP